MNSPRCNAAQNTCTFSLIMCLKNLATNTLIPTGVATTARTRGHRLTDTPAECVSGGNPIDDAAPGSAVLPAVSCSKRNSSTSTGDSSTRGSGPGNRRFRPTQGCRTGLRSPSPDTGSRLLMWSGLRNTRLTPWQPVTAPAGASWRSPPGTEAVLRCDHRAEEAHLPRRPIGCPGGRCQIGWLLRSGRGVWGVADFFESFQSG